jgi:hypothetical protein
MIADCLSNQCGLCDGLVIDYFGLPKMIKDGLIRLFVFLCAAYPGGLAEHAMSLRSEVQTSQLSREG